MTRDANDGSEEIFLSVVVLCYRSEEAIVPLVKQLSDMLAFFRFSYELVLVGNYVEGASDTTPEVVRGLEAALPHVRAIVRPKKGGMGWDMRSGLNAAMGKYICVIDGDGQYPLESIFPCLIKMHAEGFDIAKTYRVRREDGIYRRFISMVYNWLFGALFGTSYRDVNSKPKIIRRTKFALLDLCSDDWFTDAEIMIRAHQLGLKVAELPIHFYELAGRSSFVRPSAVWEFIRNLWRYRSRMKRTASGYARPAA